MRRQLTRALLPVSSFLLLVLACGGSATSNGDTQGTTGGREATGGQATTGGQPTTGGQSTGGSAGEGSVICSLPKMGAGLECLAYSPSLWHDPETDECEPFIYGGCNGTANRFNSLAACLGACGGKPSLDACDRATDCALTSPGCCAACEPLEITDLISINASHLDDKVCDVACGACPPLGANERDTGQYFVAACVDHRCAVQDIRTTKLTACNVDSDCRLRLGAGCCEACTGEPVAVNASANLCPDGPLPCPACANKIPPGYGSVCAEGRCRVTEPPCTLAHPCP